ncbi:LOW QUALITY PROTEIN: 30S ribosomal protein S2, partial [Frankliniella fusca]
MLPTLKPVGHQSTNWMVRLDLMVAMAAFTSLGTTSPRNSMQQAICGFKCANENSHTYVCTTLIHLRNKLKRKGKWTHHCGGDLRRRVHGELELGLFAIVDGEPLHEQGGEAGAGAAAERVEEQEALQARALVGQLADAVEHQVHDLLADGVVAAGVVVGRVLLARDELLRVEQLAVPVRTSSTTVGSRSTNTARGTCLPAPVSLKKVLNESSPPPTVLSEGIWPSGWMPCSRQYSSQHALPVCTPACPTWTEMHSLMGPGPRAARGRGAMDRNERPAPGRDLELERASSEELARPHRPADGFPGGCRGRPTLTVAAVVTAVRSLQEKRPRGARLDEILVVLGPAFPALTASCLRRELAPLLKRAVGSRLLRCDARRNYTVLRRHKTHVDPDITPRPGPAPTGPEVLRRPRARAPTRTAARAGA